MFFFLLSFFKIINPDLLIINSSNKCFLCFNQGYISNNLFKGNSNSEFDEIFKILNFLRSLIKEIIKLTFSLKLLFGWNLKIKDFKFLDFWINWDKYL